MNNIYMFKNIGIAYYYNLKWLVSHDPSEIILICWFAAQFLITIIVEKGCATELWLFYYNFFAGFFWWIEELKNIIYLNIYRYFIKFCITFFYQFMHTFK